MLIIKKKIWVTEELLLEVSRLFQW